MNRLVAPGTSGRWLERVPRSREPSCRLFCFPHAGGAASTFREWPQRLPSTIELCAVQLPGRERRLSEEPFTRFDEIIPVVAAAIEPCLDRPFAFFGHSLGGLIAFEVSRLLRGRGARQPIHLFVSGCNSADKLEHGVPINKLSDSDLLGQLRRYDGTPDDVLMDQELMELALPLLRADLTLAESYLYRAGEPLNCPISVYGGESDSATTQEGLEEWKMHTTGLFTVTMFPGGHFFLHGARDRILNLIAAEFATLRLDRAR